MLFVSVVFWRGHRPLLVATAGLIPLVSEKVHNMKSIYEMADDDDIVDIDLSLDVRCTTDETISITTDDIQLDPMHPGELLVPSSEPIVKEVVKEIVIMLDFPFYLQT